MKRSNTVKEDEMQARHTLEKKRLPKILKNEAKTRAAMFKQSLRLSTIGTPDDDRSKIKQVLYNYDDKSKIKQVLLKFLMTIDLKLNGYVKISDDDRSKIKWLC